MIPGLGLLRRSITLALCALSFWAGMRFQMSAVTDACLDRGGRIAASGVCEGVE
ncbi:MAG: hypothetical protein AAGF74_15340 [Pseudomonadota bacterium]